MKTNLNEFRSYDGNKIDSLTAEEIHEHYRNIISNMKQSHEENVRHMKYKLQSLESPQADDEYLVSMACLFWYYSKESPLW